jgi:hypothetical protein
MGPIWKNEIHFDAVTEREGTGLTEEEQDPDRQKLHFHGVRAKPQTSAVGIFIGADMADARP